MVSADVVDSMNQILPKEQNLLPISFKRKIDYTGHYMQEYVDRKKLEVYFRWFQRHNHLFKDMTLDKNLIDKFENEAQKIVENLDVKKDGLMTNHDTIEKRIRQTNDELYDSDEVI